MPFSAAPHKKTAVGAVIVCANLVFCLAGGGVVSADQAETPVSTEPVIVAKEALSQKERAASDRQYRFQYRHKSMMLKVIPGADSVGAAAAAEGQPLTQEEMTYRYFGTATSLYEQGKIEEAIEILKYILEKDPKNEYVRSYLQRAINANKFQESRYKVQAKQGAALFKKQKIKDALQEGIGYYKQQRYDKSAARFSQALELDPGNMQAQHYMKLIKQDYAREIRIENIVSGQQAGGSAKYDALLDEAELRVAVDDIIAKEKEEEGRTNVMTLGPGDALDIYVQEHPELSGPETVGSTGHIVLPLVNVPVLVEGRTPREANEKITEALSNYVKEPSVTTTVLSYNKMFYVLDDGGCTPYPINRPDFTLRDALFLSDWGGGRALGRVLVMKPDKLHPVTKKIDAFDIIYRGNLANNIKIENGDVIYIPMTVNNKVSSVVYDSFAPFAAFQAVRAGWWSMKWSDRGWKDWARMPKLLADQPDPPPSGFGSGSGYGAYGGWGGGGGGWGNNRNDNWQW